MILWTTPSYGIGPKSRLISAVSAHAVALSTFKQWIKWDADDTSEDLVMDHCIISATKQAENYTRRVISPGTWRSYFTCFPGSVSFDVLPVTLSSIVVKYLDENNALQTLDAGEYTLIDNGENDFVKIYFDGDLPSLYDTYEPVYIEYTAGYTDLPEDIRVAILSRATDLFEQRGNEQSGALNEVVFGFHKQLFPYKML